eukprot:1161809-Pelagomonas_calceolata.AAC.4
MPLPPANVQVEGAPGASLRACCPSRWEANSYGYHGDDGQKYSSSGKGEEYGPMFGTGDVIGAGIHLSRKEIFFT